MEFDGFRSSLDTIWTPDGHRDVGVSGNVFDDTPPDISTVMELRPVES